jgi:hypothetical protein
MVAICGPRLQFSSFLRNGVLECLNYRLALHEHHNSRLDNTRQDRVFLGNGSGRRRSLMICLAIATSASARYLVDNFLGLMLQRVTMTGCPWAEA